ncbi:MAG TPA: hypothetical protein VGE07_02550 [Herpetosiphonaceae bacterium]
MTNLAIALGSIAALAAVLWIFSRVAWGGGMRGPDFAAYAGEQQALPDAQVRPLPGADPERTEFRCAQCSFAKAVPGLASLQATLAGLAEMPVNQPCPACGGALRLALSRQITHYGPGGAVSFTARRMGGQGGRGPEIEIDGTIYRSLHEIADPALRRQVAEALNLSEDTDDYSRNQ